MSREERFVIRCKKCRVKLFSDCLLTEHTRSVMDAICGMKKEVCNCLFVDGENERALAVLATMGSTSEMEGLLCCFKCTHKVGRFSYRGQQCSCTEWVYPSFQVSVSKVDNSRKRQTYFKLNQTAYFQPQDHVEREEEAKKDVE